MSRFESLCSALGIQCFQDHKGMMVAQISGSMTATLLRTLVMPCFENHQLLISSVAMPLPAKAPASEDKIHHRYWVMSYLRRDNPDMELSRRYLDD